MNQTQSTSEPIVVNLRAFVKACGAPFQRMYPPAEGEPWTNAQFADRRVRLEDFRRALCRPQLATDGFALIGECPAPRLDAGSPADERRYAEEIADLVGRWVDGEVRVFDHQAREQRGAVGEGGIGREAAAPLPGAVVHAHADYSHASAWRVIRSAFPDAAAGERFLVLNVWRSADDPVRAFPLALCARASVRDADRVHCELRYPGRTGEFQLLRGEHHHRWGYFPRLRPSEALVFVSYDTAHDEGSATFHCAVQTDASPTAVRRSIESRCVVRFRNWRGA